MKRLLSGALAAAAITVSSSCAPYADIGVTTSESLVAACQKVGDVSVKESTPPHQVNIALSDAARKQGANYVLVASEGARSGEAYRCQAREMASR